MRSLWTQHLTLERQLPHVTTAGFMVATVVPKAGTLLVLRLP